MKELFDEVLKTIGELTIGIIIILMVMMNFTVERKQSFTEALRGESHIEIKAEASDLLRYIIESIED